MSDYYDNYNRNYYNSSPNHIDMVRFIGGSLLEGAGIIMQWGGLAGAAIGFVASGFNIGGLVPGVISIGLGKWAERAGNQMMRDAQTSQ